MSWCGKEIRTQTQKEESPREVTGRRHCLHPRRKPSLGTESVYIDLVLSAYRAVRESIYVI
jgi:hypothetical protein